MIEKRYDTRQLTERSKTSTENNKASDTGQANHYKASYHQQYNGGEGGMDKNRAGEATAQVANSGMGYGLSDMRQGNMQPAVGHYANPVNPVNPVNPLVEDVRRAARQTTRTVNDGQSATEQTTSSQPSWQMAWDGVWAKITGQFRAEFGETSYRRFLASLVGVKHKDGVVTFRAENFFQAEWVKKNYRYWLLQRLQIEKWQVSDIDFIIGERSDDNGADRAVAASIPTVNDVMGAIGDANPSKGKKLLGSELLNQFQFDNLVVGDSNEEAINAARQMLDSFPKLPFNPLFIYGAVGFGKTHLLNAIGHYQKQRHPRKKILYFTAEDFLQYFVTAVRQKEIFSFESNFADVDCLLIDDLHFVLGKEGALKALETIVGQFLDRGKMMVLVADRGPKDLTQLGQRILSRLLSGLATELKPLSTDMQRAVLRLKAMQKGIDLSNEAMDWLAEKLNEGHFGNHDQVSPRALSGIINQLMIKMELGRQMTTQQARAQAGSELLSLKTCQTLLADFFRAERKKITIDTIQHLVAEHYDITLEELLGKSRLQDIARPRQVAMYLAKMATTRSLPSIGARFSRDHTTVIHAVKTVEGRMIENPKFQEEVVMLLNKLKSNETKPREKFDRSKK